jgi:D-lactate dehydrogenase
MSLRIAFFDTKPYDRDYFDRHLQNAAIEITYFTARLDAATAPLVKGFDAVCAFVNDRIDAGTANILAENGVKLVGLRCAGYNNIDLKAVFGRIHVVRVPAYSPHAVAEFAIALLLSLNRKTHRAYYRTRDANFTLNGLCGIDLHGKTAGVIGTGKIGRITAQILKGFGMEVLVADPHPDAAWATAAGVTVVELDELFRRADVLSLHCPLTPATRHLINAETLALMKPTAMIINTGRGGLINTKALIAALKDRTIGGAALDVYEEEENYFFEDHSLQAIDDDVLARLLTFPNVLVTSHQAFFTEEALTAIAKTTIENIQQFFAKNELPNEICYHCSASSPCPRDKTGRCF